MNVKGIVKESAKKSEKIKKLHKVRENGKEIKCEKVWKEVSINNNPGER